MPLSAITVSESIVAISPRFFAGFSLPFHSCALLTIKSPAGTEIQLIICKYLFMLAFLFATFLLFGERAFSADGSSEICAASITPNSVLRQGIELSCDIFAISNDILSSQEVVPKKIYHYGKKKFLMEDINARTVPEQAWNQFIMGNNTRFGLNHSRRGLYGTSGLDTNSFGFNEYNWIMEISIVDECRKPDRVLTLIDLPKNARFEGWYKKQKRVQGMRFEEFCDKCYYNDLRMPKMSLEGFRDHDCDSVVTKFMNEAGIAIVLDQIAKKSFYIRDRSCIETIQGKPEEWVHTLAVTTSLWQTRCGAMQQWNLNGLLLQSLAESKEEPSPTELASLRKNVSQLLEGTRLLDKMQVALDAYIRCAGQKRQNEFRARIKHLLDESLNIDFLSSKAFELLCREHAEVKPRL